MNIKYNLTYILKSILSLNFFMTEQGEYAERPVPRQARLGLMKPALVWADLRMRTFVYL
jgi:hypothetical protein